VTFAKPPISAGPKSRSTKNANHENHLFSLEIDMFAVKLDKSSYSVRLREVFTDSLGDVT
jgi:hypothetical protein